MSRCLTLAELVERTGHTPDLLRRVLAEEIVRGRVVRTVDGGYALDATCFSPDVLGGLRALSGLRPIESERVAELAIVGTEDAG